MSILFVICGHSFAGKSTLGRALVERFGFEEVDVDVTKRELYGPDVEDEQLTQPDWNHIYTETDNRIVDLLRAAKTVVDASRNFQKTERRHIGGIVSACGGRVVTIYVDTPEAIVRQRLLENRRTRTRVDWSDAQFDELINAMEPPGTEEGPLIFHYEDNIPAWMTEHIAPIVSASFE